MATNISFGGSIPEKYDKYLTPLFFEPYADDLISRIKGREYDSILELACGTGRVTMNLRREFPGSKLTATDINPDMLSVARKNVTHPNVVWDTVDMQEIPFDDSSYDLIVCQFGVMFVPDKVKAFKEIYRVLKPGGRFVFNVWESFQRNLVSYHTDQVINSFFGEDPVMFIQIPFSYHNKTEIGNHLQNGGFSDFSFDHVKREMDRINAGDASIGLIEGNPSINAINERKPELLDEIRMRLKATLAENFGDNPMKYSLEAIVCEAEK